MQLDLVYSKKPNKILFRNPLLYDFSSYANSNFMSDLED